VLRDSPSPTRSKKKAEKIITKKPDDNEDEDLLGLRIDGGQLNSGRLSTIGGEAK
jgi:hypothetical protein